VIKKPRGQGGHSLHWAAEPEKINNKYTVLKKEKKFLHLEIEKKQLS
jgi:hypothetical protein